MSEEFDKDITSYYLEKDAENGYMEVENRKGILEQFPIVSLIIAVVNILKERFNNILEIGEVGAGVKHLVKTIPGISYVIKRREKGEWIKKHSKFILCSLQIGMSHVLSLSSNRSNCSENEIGLIPIELAPIH